MGNTNLQTISSGTGPLSVIAQGFQSAGGSLDTAKANSLLSGILGTPTTVTSLNNAFNSAQNTINTQTAQQSIFSPFSESPFFTPVVQPIPYSNPNSTTSLPTPISSSTLSINYTPYYIVGVGALAVLFILKK
jgi:hypothetical protein